ncbi:MAG: hypothetical protein JWO41_935 [Candidatus Saccharibacteria bacterium]|nr:hypothetical protein [Candidatus Saccharibacteria bacterium]
MAGNEQSVRLLQDVSSVIFKEQQRHPSVARYIETLSDIYRQRTWKGLLAGFCELVDVQDPACADPSKPGYVNFSLGVDLGLRVVHGAKGSTFLSEVISGIHFTEYDVEADSAKPDEDRSGIVVATIFSMADKGMAAGDPNSVIMERWEEAVTEDYRYQHYARRGFGFVLNMSHEIMALRAREAEAEAIHTADMTIFQAEIHDQSGGDWSAALSELGL